MPFGKAARERKQQLAALTDVSVSDIEKRYEFQEEAGTGTSSAVFLAADRQSMALSPSKSSLWKMVAVKVFHRKALLSSKSGALEVVRNEVELLRTRVRHPCVVRLVETITDTKSFGIVLEALQGGDLFSWLSKAALPEHAAKSVFANAALAVEHLHAQGIVHRDIKAENFVAESRNSTFFKLVDFGSCAEIAGGVHGMASTAHYCAPEVLHSAGFHDATGGTVVAGSGAAYGASCDVWSLGVLLFFMLTRKLPFGSTKDGDTAVLRLVAAAAHPIGFERAATAKAWKALSVDARALIETMVKVEAAARPSWADIKVHTWAKQAIAEREATIDPADVGPIDMSAATAVAKAIEAASGAAAHACTTQPAPKRTKAGRWLPCCAVPGRAQAVPGAKLALSAAGATVDATGGCGRAGAAAAAAPIASADPAAAEAAVIQYL